jgi:hypothetical protein
MKEWLSPALATAGVDVRAWPWCLAGRPWSRRSLRGSERAFRFETPAGASAAASARSVPIRNRTEAIGGE